MKFCQKCFADEILKSQVIIAGRQSSCDLCSNANDFVYDTQKDKYLIDYFSSFISIFSPIEKIENFQSGQEMLLKTEVATNWNIFTTNDEYKVYQMLSEICKELFEEIPNLLNSPVGVDKMYDPIYLQEHSLFSKGWECFVEDIKYNNRFHSNQINKGILAKYCEAIQKTYSRGEQFFRCRISKDRKQFEPKEIGAPPKGKSADGRANARGIVTLYLGDTEKTAIHETRTGLYDHVCIGTFELKSPITVIDFKKINEISPFLDGIIDDIAELAINKKHLKQIDYEMGRVMRKTDDVLDYLPTQYIADFVRSIVSEEYPEQYAFQGIEFRSVMNPEGFNLAIFTPECFDVIDIKMKRINQISYVW
jgi:sepS16C protein